MAEKQKKARTKVQIDLASVEEMLAFENSHRFIVISTKMGLKYGTNAARLSFCFSSFYLFFVAFASNLLSLDVRTNHLSDSAHNVTT